jgi:hypothetical protein
MIYTVNFGSINSYEVRGVSVTLESKYDRDTGLSKALREWKNPGQDIYTHMKESTEDSFCFIITKAQYPHFMALLKKYDLKKHIVRKTENIRNENYIEEPPRYKLIVLQHPEHLQRKVGYTAELTAINPA